MDADAIACWVAIAAEAVHLPEVREPFEQVVQRQRDELTDILTTHHACAHEEAAAIAAAILSMIHGAYLLSRSTEAVLHTGFAAARLRAAAHGMIRAAADMEARHD